MKKLLIAAAALVTVGAPVAATAQPVGGFHPVAVQNHWVGGHPGGWGHGWGGGYRYGYGYGRYGYGYGPGFYRGAAVAGLFGLALLASERPYYAPCHYVTRTVIGPYGGVRYQNVEVCR